MVRSLPKPKSKANNASKQNDSNPWHTSTPASGVPSSKSAVSAWKTLKPFTSVAFKKSAASKGNPFKDADGGTTMFSFTPVQRKNEAKKSAPNSSMSRRVINHNNAPTNELGLNVSKPRNRKRMKRAQRRQRLKSRIETNTVWKMVDNAGDDEKDASQQNGSTPSSMMNVSSLFESLQDAEQEIAKEQRKKASSNPRRQLKTDQMNLVQLFKNEQFDADPLKFTAQMMEQRNHMQSQHIEWIDPTTKNKAHDSKNKRRRNGSTAAMSVGSNGGSTSRTSDDHGHGHGGAEHDATGHARRTNNKMKANDSQQQQQQQFTDDDLKKEIAKQLSLTRMKKQNSQNAKTKQNNKKLIASMGKMKLKSAPSASTSKLSGGGKHGKFDKKLKKKMSQFAKDNQKKRRWRR